MNSYEIRKMVEGDTDSVLDHLRSFFFKDEPLMKAVDLLNGRNTCEELEQLARKIIKDDLSLVATVNGTVVALSLNTVSRRNLSIKKGPSGDHKIDMVFRLLEHASENANLFAKYPSIDRHFVVAIISVDSMWRGKGIGKNLVIKSRELAVQNGFKLIKANCSSQFSASLMKRQGFDCVYRQKYEDYKEDEVSVLVPESPHTEIGIYAQIIS